MKITSHSHIVMVDDNEADVYFAREGCTRSSVDNPWLSFSSGEGFLAYLAKVRAERAPMPALVLLDINMPGMNGIEVLDSVKRDSYFEERPIFCIYSSSSDPRDQAAAKKLGAAGFVTKFGDIRECINFFDSLKPASAP